MNTPLPNTVMVVLLLIAVIATVAWLMLRQQRLRRKRRLGPEYDLTVSEFHGRKEEPELLNARSMSPN